MNEREDRYKEGLKKGDILAFEELFRTFYAPMCDYCMRYVSDLDTAQEIVQDLFFKIWVRREEIVFNTSIKSYLYRSLHNQALNHLNHLKIHDRYQQFIEIRAKTDINYPTDVLEEQDMERIMKIALGKLPEKRRKIFELSRFENLKYNEIADRLNISVKTVESQMTKALEQLRKVLDNYLSWALLLVHFF